MPLQFEAAAVWPGIGVEELMMFHRFPLILCWLVVLVVPLALGACSSSGDDDDDDGPSYGEPIEAPYNVVMTIEVDTCDPDNEEATEEWVVDIIQSDDLSVAWVKYQEFGGIGQDWVDLFKGQVYGTVVLKAGVDTSPIAGSDCTKISVQDFSVKVDLETSTLSGRLSTDIFYMGAGCDSSNIDCNFERRLTPGTPAD